MITHILCFLEINLPRKDKIEYLLILSIVFSKYKCLYAQATSQLSSLLLRQLYGIKRFKSSSKKKTNWNSDALQADVKTFTKVNADKIAFFFIQLNELKKLTLCSYQIKQSMPYIVEHLKTNEILFIYVPEKHNFKAPKKTLHKKRFI